jgi:uncharacterized membrane protein
MTDVILTVFFVIVGLLVLIPYLSLMDIGNIAKEMEKLNATLNLIHLDLSNINYSLSRISYDIHELNKEYKEDDRDD